MAASIDFNEDSIYLLNKYFIQPVLSLNTSLTNIDSSVINFNNSSTITIINASILANTSSITIINASILANTSSITTINTSLNNAIDTVNSTTLTIGGTNGTSTQSYASALTSGTLNIGNSQTAGILNIGTGNNVVRSGAINMATVTGSTCPINILNSGGATTGGSVNIANGLLQTTTVNIASGTGTGTVTIGNASNTTNINSLTTNINGNTNIARNTAGTNPTYIECVSGTTLNYMDFHCNSSNNIDYDARISVSGGTATVGQGDFTIQSKSLTISSPLTLQSSASYTLPTVGQLSYTYYAFLSADTNVGGSVSTDIVLRITSIPIGTYSCNWQYRLMNTNATGSTVFFTMGHLTLDTPYTTPSKLPKYTGMMTQYYSQPVSSTSGSGNNQANSGSCIIQVPSSQDIYLIAKVSYSTAGGVLQYSALDANGYPNTYLILTRIA